MARYINLLLAVAFLSILSSSDAINATEMILKIGEDCKTKEKATDDDMKLLTKTIEEKKSETSTVKCMRACMLDAFFMLTDDEKKVKQFENTIKAAMKDKPAKVAIAAQKECYAKVKAEERCEGAGKFATCIEEKGFNIGDFIEGIEKMKE